MGKIIITTTFCFIAAVSFSQNIAINTTGAAGNPAAILDVSATDKGMLLPRVVLTSTIAGAPISPALGAAETSLLVYNTNTVNDVTPGFYYWDGVNSKWVRLVSSNSSNGPCYTCDGW